VQSWSLKQKQSLPLEAKVILSKKRIKEWYEAFDGNVYVSFSGGKDSTVLLHLVRSIYPEVQAVFMDTGLEFPEIRSFVKTIDNVVWLKPKIPFTKVIEKYGYPVLSKKVAMAISRYRNTKSEFQKELRMFGGQNPTSKKYQAPTIPKKFHTLTKENKFKISERCCDYLKKNPIKVFEKETKKVPFIGTMTIESVMRKEQYIKYGCNSFELQHPQSKPLSIWLEKDIWQYLKLNKIPYSKIYDMGYDRTGCVFCMFGVHLEKSDLFEKNRFEKMKLTHPKLYDYCINNLGLGKVLTTIGVNY